MKVSSHQYKNDFQLPRQPKEPLLNVPFIIVVLIIFCFCLYCIPQYLFSHQLYIKSLELFSFTPELFKADPVSFFYTMVSYSFMHGSFKHVALNMVWLLVFGSPLVRQFGVVRFLIFWVLTAAISVLTYFTFHQESIISLVGASGAVSGMMGAIARYGFPSGSLGINAQNEKPFGPLLSIKKALCSKSVLIYISVWLAADFIIGISSVFFEENGISIAWEAHIGGFVAGVLFVGFFDVSQKN
ncbi:rhomboid family intramembrane serine protease [Bartonella tribocorum]|uniref:Rhomboid family intramembrane serine protease n=1 Tax=Bartonella tribocorum TaxID=85701 RepID=A0A2M6UY48_9HYPH|nr:rhomboid family intramembrane serine protease [Bartonella tribocorum]PIT70984.1 rhomboid family intramembrane serine protease [Bartonella tribocorum]